MRPKTQFRIHQKTDFRRRLDMAKKKLEIQHGNLKQVIMNVAAKNFLQHGYTNTTIKMITTEVGISTGSFNNIFQTKEDLLCELVAFVLNQQFSTTTKLIEGKTDDTILFYAAETTLQLHIVEMNENLRDVYAAAYSLPKPSAMIQQTITGKWEKVFGKYLPDLETKDFYKLEIATGGIMRGFMTIPCDMWFTMDQKIESFLECTFRLYSIPPEKIREAIEFVKQFDFAQIAQKTIAGIIDFLEGK